MDLKEWRKLLLPTSLEGLAGYTSEPDTLIGGNRLTLLQDGRAAYPAMLAAIAAAEVSVNLETYILKDDKTGWLFADALAERAKAGVQVRVIFDSLGSLGLRPRYLQNLRNNGVQMLEYRPVAPWRQRWGWGKRDHRKILVVDGRIGFTGGINIADEHAAPEDGGGGWRDTHVKIEGPAAFELDRLFRSVWFRETGRWFSASGDHTAGPGDAHVRVAANEEFLKRHLIRRAYLHAIDRAERRIAISHAYFIPDSGVRRALYAARRRGVDIRLLLPSVSDVPAVTYAGRYFYSKHLSNGLRLFAWPAAVLHAKSMAIDRAWSAIGSYNFTHRSLLHNLEVNLHIIDAEFSGRLEDELLSDMSRSDEITAELWERRRAWERVLERFFYLLRYWF